MGGGLFCPIKRGSAPGYPIKNIFQIKRAYVAE